jgi:hypothetical protein
LVHAEEEVQRGADCDAGFARRQSICFSRSGIASHPKSEYGKYFLHFIELDLLYIDARDLLGNRHNPTRAPAGERARITGYSAMAFLRRVDNTISSHSSLGYRLLGPQAFNPFPSPLNPGASMQ